MTTSFANTLTLSSIEARGALILIDPSTLDDAVAAFNPIARIRGKTIIRVRP